MGRGATERPASTAAGAERAIVVLVVGTRLGMLVQGLPSLLSGVSLSPAPRLYLACWAAAASAAVAVSVVSVVRGRGLPDRWQALDLTVAVALLLLGPLTVAPDHRIGTWEGFQPGYAVAVVMSIAVVRSRALWSVGVVALVVGQVWFVASALDTASLTTSLGNVFTLVVLGLVGRAGVQYLRRVAAEADEARAWATEMARREEGSRARVAMHNSAAVMHLLADPGLDEVTRDRLLEQVPHEATRMRAYLRGVPRHELDGVGVAGGHGDDALLLDRLVGEACRDFDDLAIEAALDLGQGVRVHPEVADAVQNALTSLLLNVRQHAGARQVVVHLDAGEERPPTGWVLSVHDDGRGFDPGSTARGVGLRDVVVGGLDGHGIEVRIASAPGAGTTVTLAGPALVPAAPGGVGR